MGSRGPSAQYAYGITVEVNKDYQKELKTLSDGLENLDKKIKATQKSFDSGIQNKGNKGFEQVQKQTADIVESVDRLLQLEKELGGVNAPKIFDGLKQNRDDIAKLSGSIKDIRENFAALNDTVKSLPSDLFSRLSDLFVYDEKGATGKLKDTAESIKGIINDIGKSTDKEKLSSLMGQLTQMVSEFQIGLTQATNKGWDVSSRALAQTLTDLKGMMPQLSEAGDGFDVLATKIVGFYNTIGQQYKSKHPTGKAFFNDIIVDAAKTQTSIEQTANKIVTSFNAAINVVNKFKNSDMGLAEKSKEMDEFLAKLKNPEITIDLKNKDIIKEFGNLGDEFDKIVGWNNVDVEFLQNLPIADLQKLGDVLQNIIAIGRKYSGSLSKDLGISGSAFKEEISDYGSDLGKVITELENRLNTAKESVQQLSSQLQEMIEKAGLKSIELKLDVPADSEIDAYVEKINGFIDKIIKQTTRIKKIPMSIAFDDSKQETEGEKVTDPSAKLKDQLNSLKKSIHDARTSIESDAREIKSQLMNMLKLDNKDISNITSAMEALFNEQPLKLYVDGEFLIGEIEKILNSKTFNIAANISGTSYSGGFIPISGGAPASDASAAATQSSAASTQVNAAADQSKAASDNVGAADTQSGAARDQKDASATNSKSAALMSKAVAQFAAFTKSFGETYYKSLSKQKAMNDKIARGEEVSDRTTKMTNGRVAKLTPMANYLQDIFGKDTDLSKITEEYVRNILTGLLQKNSKTGGFKGELLGSDLSDLLGKWKGSYKNQTALLSPLLGKGGTFESLFKSLGLSTISSDEKINRDYNAPKMLEFYQKYAKMADVIDSLNGEKGDTKQLLSELSSMLKEMQSTTASQEYKDNIEVLGKSINTLYSNMKEYNQHVIATKDLSQGESNEYTALLNMFKQFYGTASANTQTLLNSIIGVNPSEEILHGDALRTAVDAMSKISGDDASSKIANDIVSWLNRMIAGDNVVISRQTLLGQLGKGEKGAGLKIASSKNGRGKMTAYGIANNMLSDLNADIYYEGVDKPTVIDRSDSPTAKRKALRMISNLLNTKSKLGTKTQFYSKDNKRPAPFDVSQIKVNDEYSIDWDERLAAAEKSIQQSSKQLEEAKKARDEKLSELARQEEEVDKKLQEAREGIKSVQSVLDNISPSVYDVPSEIESLKSDYKQQKDIYDLMVKYQSNTPNKSTLKFEGKGLSNDYIQLLEAKKQAESRLTATENTAKQYKKYEESPELLSKVLSVEQKKQESIEKEIKEVEFKISEAKKVENKGLLSKYQAELADKQNELEQSKSRLSNYTKVQNREKVSSEFESKAKEQEITLQEINRQIQQSVTEQRQKLDDNLFEQLQATIVEYKQRQQELSSFEKDLKEKKVGTVEYDKVAAKILTAKEYLNGLFDSITNLGSSLNFNDEDLKDLAAGMDKQSFYNSKNARDSLRQQIDAFKQFKNSKNFDLSNLEIFPKELQTLLQQRSELFNEKNSYDNAKAELKDYKQRLQEAKQKGNAEIQAILQRRVDALRVDVNNARPKKEINADIGNLNTVIQNYISSIVQQYGTYFKKAKTPLQKYDVGDSITGKYTNSIESQRTSLIPLTEQKKSIELEKEALDNQVKRAEQQLKIAERSKQIAQLQIEYNQKKDEELALVREISKLEESGAAPTELSEKTQTLNVVNAEVSRLYNNLKEINGINSSNIFDDSLSPEQKKLNALEKIQELQQTIIRNNEQIGKLGDYTKDVQKAQKLTFNKEQGGFTTIYGNKSSAADDLQKMFVANYTSTDEFRNYRTALYSKAQEKIDELQNAIANRISEVINNMYQNAATNFVKSKYDETGVSLHQMAWDTAQATVEQEIQETIESRLRKISNAENKAIEEILKNEDLSNDELIDEISRTRGIFDVQRESLNSGEAIKNIINKKTQKFFDVYYDNFSKLLVEKFGEDSVDEQLKGSLKSVLSGMTMSKGTGKDQVETAFGKRVSEIFNQAEETEKTIRKRIYDSVDRKLGESISAYMGTISEDVTRLEGETADDKVFTDGKGFRVNLSDLYRKKNAYAIGIKEALEKESKDAELLIEKYKAYGGISKEEIAHIAEARDRAYAKLYGGSDSDINNLDILIGSVDTTPATDAAQNIANQVVKTGADAAENAVSNKLTSSDSTSVGSSKNDSKPTKEELEARLAALEKLANDKLTALERVASSNTAKSREVTGLRNDTYADITALNDIKTFQQFKTAILSLTDLVDRGLDVSKQNVEYGFTEKDGKMIEFAVGDLFQVTFDKIEQDIDSMTHSHAYKKGMNNLMFSLSDIDQLADFADENNLKKYNMIYGRQMMSIDLGKDSLGTALDIAEKYPIINDVVTAMFSTVNGEDVAAQNSGEMARILNGYLQRAVQEAGGKLSVSDVATGRDVSNLYSIADEEYNKLNNVISNFQSYYDRVLDGDVNVSKQDYVGVIRDLLSKEFGANVISDLTNRAYDKSAGGISAEYSALPDKADAMLRNLLDSFISTSKSKKLTSYQQGFYDEYKDKDLSISEITDSIYKLREALGIGAKEIEDGAKDVKQTLTKSQIDMLNSDYNGAWKKKSIEDAGKVFNWNNSTYANIEQTLGKENESVVKYNAEMQNLRSIADDIRAKGEKGIVITNEDLQKLDSAIEKTRELQNELVENAKITNSQFARVNSSNRTEPHVVGYDALLAAGYVEDGHDDLYTKAGLEHLQRIQEQNKISNLAPVSDEEIQKEIQSAKRILDSTLNNKVSGNSIKRGVQGFLDGTKDIGDLALVYWKLCNNLDGFVVDPNKAKEALSKIRSVLDKKGVRFEVPEIGDDWDKFLDESIDRMGYYSVDTVISGEEGGVNNPVVKSIIQPTIIDGMGNILKRMQVEVEENAQNGAEQIVDAAIQSARQAIGQGTEESKKQTLTKSQMEMLNPDSTSAWTKRSIKNAGKTLSWKDKNYADVSKVLGTDDAVIQDYTAKFKELQQIAADIRTKGENGTVITDTDLQKLDDAIAKVQELQTTLTKNAKIQSAYQALDKEGRIVSGDNKISESTIFTDRQAIMEAYAKQYAASKNSQYDFSQYDFVKDKISFDMVDADGKITSVIMSWSDAFNAAYIQSEKLQDSCDSVTTSIHKINQAIVDGQKEGFFDKNSKEMQAYQEAMDTYGKAQEAVKNSTADNLDENIAKLQAAQEELVKLGNGVLGKSKDAYGYNSATKVLSREDYIRQTLDSYNDQSVNVNDLAIVKEYFNALDALKKKKDELAQSGKLLSNSEGEQAALKLLADRAAEAEKALLGADEAQRKINSNKADFDIQKMFSNINPQNINEIKNAMLGYVNSVKGANFKGFNAETRTMAYEVRIGKNEVQEFTISMGELGNAVEIIPGKIKPVETGLQSFINGIKGKFKEVGTYLASFGSIYRLWGAIKQGVTYVQNIDSALTELKKVTDETDETYAKFLNTMAQTGASVGATTSDLTNMAANWARLNN